MVKLALIRELAAEEAMVYRPTARVLTVLELLQAHGRMTGAALAERLEVDVRTVRSYIETIQDLGIPVEAERGRYGAYRLRPGFKLPPLIFTEDEAVALTLSLLATRESGLAASAPALTGALAKIERVLPEATRAQVRAIGETVIFADATPRRAAPPAPAAVATLSAAVQAGRSVHLRYRSARAQETERAFDPWGVVAHAGVWYTIGHCHARGGQRLFRLDRIAAVTPLDAPFDRPEGFDALAAVQRSLASIPSVWQIEVWLDTTLEAARWRTGRSDAYFEEADGGVIMRGEVANLDWMARDLAGLGVPLVVRRPDELRVALRRYALALARSVGGARKTGTGDAETRRGRGEGRLNHEDTKGREDHEEE
jgi:predicted DNA-binding transcriptional regulator YafY